MKNLSTAIFSKMTSSTDLYSDIGGRLFKDFAPDGAEYPYIVYSVASNSPDNVFSGNYEETTIQFNLFSSASGSTEVEDMYEHLIALYDECSLMITAQTLIWMRRENATLMVEDHTVKNGTVQVWRYAVDYRITAKV